MSFEEEIKKNFGEEKCIICNELLNNHDYMKLKSCFKRKRMIEDIVFMRMQLRETKKEEEK